MREMFNVSSASLHRLPIYYRCLHQAMKSGQGIMSSRDLGRACGIPATRIRKDLCCLNGYGYSSMGYDVRSLASCLESFLGLRDRKQGIIVGASSLGRALVDYPAFAGYEMHIVALFDTDPAKIGQMVGKLQVLPLDELASLVRGSDIQIGIVAMPADQAQFAVDMMWPLGIKAIWNFSPAMLRVPKGVFVKNEDLAAELAELSHHVCRAV